ncbi:MAG: hypothetical protein AAF485_24580 [Chloroflexota bacterium]
MLITTTWEIEQLNEVDLTGVGVDVGTSGVAVEVGFAVGIVVGVEVAVDEGVGVKVGDNVAVSVGLGVDEGLFMGVGDAMRADKLSVLEQLTKKSSITSANVL